MKVFVDTNVLIDVPAKRQPFYKDSAAVWTLAEQGKIEGLVSAVSFTNIFTAVQADADCMVSRNPSDFAKPRECPVLTPAEFLAAYSF